MGLHKNLRTGVRSSFNHDSQATKISSGGEWMNKPWDIQTMEYAGIKGNKLSRHEKTWSKHDRIPQSKGSPSEKALHCKTPVL